VAAVLLQDLSLPAWAGFMAWGCFFHSGADMTALKKTIAGNLFGVICAAVAIAIMLSIDVEGNIWMVRGFLATGGTLAVMVLGSAWEPLSSVPAGVYGYAATFAFVFQTPGARTTERLLHLGRFNPLLAVAIAMVAGAFFGLASKRAADAMSKS
jgi:hypothetical protein